jgi:shikimate dehydrogenase
MKKFAIFGNPVKHSKSPSMHNHFFMQNTIDAKYISICANEGMDIPDYFRTNQLSGANITVPFKEDAFLFCDEIIGLAKEAQSVNTIIKKDNQLIGYNTDGDGFFYSIKNITKTKDIKNALILGAGGTAKSIAYILKNNNIIPTILNRGIEKLQWFEQKDFICYSHNSFEISNYDIIINTTSAGLEKDELPLDKDILKSLFNNTKFVYDVIYNKQTPFITLAKENNIYTQDGKDMLIYQGVFANMLFMDNKYSFEDTAKYLSIGFNK